jgi:L-ascorbate metabolism protein UlaG (beta-lactamase superfamily)
MAQLRMLFVAMLAFVAPQLAFANCMPVAGISPRIVPAKFMPAQVRAGEVSLTFLGHASFLIETAGGASAVTDYNGYVRAPKLPDIVTMNNAHSTHYTDHPETGIKHVLRGWAQSGEMARHSVSYRDLYVFNVPTNVRDYAGTRYNGNSIFVFSTAGLCIAHLGHLHHVLTPEHLGILGKIDVLLVPVDGSYTMGQFEMMDVIQQIKPPLVIPMHYFNAATLARFLERMKTEFNYVVRTNDVPLAILTRAKIPPAGQPEIWVLPGF